jgi:hypothetical protein
MEVGKKGLDQGTNLVLIVTLPLQGGNSFFAPPASCSLDGSMKSVVPNRRARESMALVRRTVAASESPAGSPINVPPALWA